MRNLFRKNIMKSRKVARARFLYLYVIFGGLVGFSYFVVSIFRGWPMHLALTPVYLIIAFVVLRGFYKNWRGVWFYIIDVNRGRFLLSLNSMTHFEEGHKVKVAKWVYPRKNQIRKETHDKLAEKLHNGEELTNEEKKLFKRKVVICPQQPRLGFNEALLAHVLIYAHEAIQPLDDEIREILGLSDAFIHNFDIMVEANKAGLSDYEKYMEIGKRRSEELKK
jgi:hypothetical protein